MYEWKGLPWRKIERNVFKLQKRIYQASRRGDVKAVHRLHCCTNIATTKRQPKIASALSRVLMARANLLRSRMPGNWHVRF
jgi:hypothetical protein